MRKQPLLSQFFLPILFLCFIIQTYGQTPDLTPFQKFEGKQDGFSRIELRYYTTDSNFSNRIRFDYWESYTMDSSGYFYLTYDKGDSYRPYSSTNPNFNEFKMFEYINYKFGKLLSATVSFNEKDLTEKRKKLLYKMTQSKDTFVVRSHYDSYVNYGYFYYLNPLGHLIRAEYTGYGDAHHYNKIYDFEVNERGQPVKSVFRVGPNKKSFTIFSYDEQGLLKEKREYDSMEERVCTRHRYAYTLNESGNWIQQRITRDWIYNRNQTSQFFEYFIVDRLFFK